jgi:Na+/melibiose symporter-like transporter
MAAGVSQNPIATDHVPFFITPPGGSDALFHIVAWFVVACIIGIGVLFFTIHTLPERMAHRTKKVQLDIVAILCLISLFTNEHIYWIAAMILAFIELPDFLTPIQRIADAAEGIAGQAPPADTSEAGPAETGLAVTDTAHAVQKGSAHA